MVGGKRGSLLNAYTESVWLVGSGFSEARVCGWWEASLLNAYTESVWLVGSELLC